MFFETRGNEKMIVTCEKEKLNGLVQTALRAISTRVTMPILSGLLVQAEDQKLTISGTDLEISIRTGAEANVQESGTTVVSGRLLGDIVKNLSPGEVKMETGEKYLVISTSGGEYRIREMMPEDYPQIPEWEGEAVIKVSSEQLSQAVNQTSRASSSDEKRPVLTGSLIEKSVGEGSVRMVSTDSYRLAWREFEVNGPIAEWEDCIVPSKTLNEVARLAGSSDEDVEMKVQQRQAMFRTGGVVIGSRLIEGQFPNYRQLIPKGEKTTVKINKEELLEVLKRALIFGHNLKVGVYSNHLRVSTETPEVGDSQEEIPAEVEGEEMEIGFNGSYMIDGIVGVGSGEVVMRMDDPQKPALVMADGEEDYKYILMPVRLR